jgi:outer membrane receptor protein involved in Fe transport
MTNTRQVIEVQIRFLNWLVLGCLAFLLIVTVAHSQLTGGTILGAVTDESGAAVTGAKVTATNVDTGFTRTTTADNAGNYQFVNMPLGRYQIRAEAASFSSAVRGPVDLIVDQKLRSDFRLKVGSVSETVEVPGTETLLVTDQHDVSQIVQEREIKQLPLNGRDFFSLMLLSNGIQDTSTDQGGATTNVTFSVNGMRPESNSVTLDGIEMSSIRESDVDLRPNLDAISEFKVLTSAYSAEYGHTAGGVISIQSKAGTNNYHGSAFEFLRNEALNARNYFINGTKQPLKQNMFGGTLGGPIVRGKTFFFLDYQGYILHTVNAGYTNVPPIPFRSGDFSSLLPPNDDCQNAWYLYPGTTCIYDPATFNPTTGSTVQFQDPSRGTPSNPNGLNIIPLNRISPFGSYLLNSIADPNGNFPLGNFLTHQVRSYHQSDAGLRVDHTFSAKDSVFARYRWNQSWLDDANPLARASDGPSPGLDGAEGNDSRGIPQGGTSFDRNNNLVISWIHVFAPSIVNEFEGGFHRYRLSTVGHEQGLNLAQKFGLLGINTLGPQYSELPAIYLNGDYNELGGTDFKPLHFRETSVQFRDNSTFHFGLHTMKAGFEFRPRWEDNYYPLFPSGAFYFYPVRTGAPCTVYGDPTCNYGPSYVEGNDLAEILMGTPFSSYLGRRFSSAMLRDNQYAFFLQDDWKATRRFTLNLGVRYEYASPFYNPQNQMSMFDLTQSTLLIAGHNGVSRYIVDADKNNWAPRVGFAYQINAKTTLRGGFGMFYDPANAFRDDIKFNPPFYRQVTQTDNFSSVVPSNWHFLDPGPPPLPDPGPFPTGYDLFNVDRHFRIGYTDQYSLAAQHELPWQTLVEVAYVGSQGHLLPYRTQINQARPDGSPAPFPSLGQIPVVQNIGDMNYHSAQLKLEKRFSKNLFFLGAYTYSHSIDDVTSSELDAVGVQNVFDIRQNRGSSDWDIRHRLAFSYLYNLPFGHGQTFLGPARGIANAILGGWQTSGLLALSSGQPFTVVDGISIPGGDARPDMVSDPFAPGPGCAHTRTPQCWFNPAAFRLVPDPNNSSSALPGNEGRNILRAPSYKNFDLGLIKVFPLTERTRLQFRAEFFNLSNTPHFAIPANALNDPNAGQLTHTRNSTNYGSSATSYGNRVIQFALKLEF